MVFWYRVILYQTNLKSFFDFLLNLLFVHSYKENSDGHSNTRCGGVNPHPDNIMNEKSTDKEDFIIKFTALFANEYAKTYLSLRDIEDKTEFQNQKRHRLSLITAMLHSAFSSIYDDYNFTLRLRNAIVKELELDKDVLEHVLSSYSMTEKVCPYVVKELVNKVKEKV